jgi:hypothetical protein
VFQQGRNLGHSVPGEVTGEGKLGVCIVCISVDLWQLIHVQCLMDTVWWTSGGSGILCAWMRLNPKLGADMRPRGSASSCVVGFCTHLSAVSGTPSKDG